MARSLSSLAAFASTAFCHSTMTMPLTTTPTMRRLSHIIAIAILGTTATTTIQFANGFITPSSISSRVVVHRGGAVRHPTPTTTTTTVLRAAGGGGVDGANNGSDDDEQINPTTTNSIQNYDDNEEAQRLAQKAQQYRNEAEKLRLSLGIKRIDELQNDIRAFLARGEQGNTDNDKEGGSTLRELKGRAEELIRKSLGSGSEEAEKLLSSLSLGSTVSSAGGSTTTSSSLTSLPNDNTPNSSSPTDEEIQAAIVFMDGLSPGPLKDALSSLAGSSSRGWQNDMSFEAKQKYVRNLYRWKDMVTTEGLRGLYNEGLKGGVDYEDEEDDGNDDRTTKSKDRDEVYELSNMSKILASKIEERIENSTRAMELFPRSLQDADVDLLPTEADANVVFQVLGKNFMATEKPMEVNGGYIIRGVNKRKTAKELLDVLDAKLAKATIDDNSQLWQDRYQVSFVEIYSDTNDELFEDALLITPNYFTPLAPKLLSVISSSIALFSSFVYCINTFGGNTVVMQRLKEASESATAGGMGMGELAWLNDLLIPLLATLGLAQGVHEMAHILVAWSKEVKLTAPTVLPSLGLPYLSFQNRIKTSPKGYSDLFDIAFVGPIAGLTVSFVALLVGLELTTTVDPTTAQLLPCLPVGYLTQSTLGGTIVDLVLGGGDGLLLNQDASTQVPLHPVAIAGFLGLIIHALDFVPVGSADGGRMSQAVLGRVWHLTFSSLVFLVLFISSLTTDSNILLGYLFVYSFTQRDMEIPCRNEVDKVELPRAVAALVSWLLAALILVPLR
ncbi:hypothetical protein ACHAXH_010058 [Discostella pseudostelligera]